MPTSHAGPLPASSDELTLFAFDDFSLPFQYNLALHMVGGRKHPDNPVLRRSADGPDAFGLQMGTILREDGRYRYWYGGLAEAFDRTSQPSLPLYLCYAESDDGVHWRRPNLGLAEWRGSTANNLIPIEPRGASGAHPVHCPSVLYDPEDPDPARRYKMTYMTWVPADLVRDARNADTGDPTGPYGLMQTAVSPDGLHWRLASEGLPLPEWFEVNGLHRFHGWYYATGQQFAPWVWLPGGRECGRVMVAFRSRDFVHWSRAKALCFQRPGQASAPPGSAEEVHMGAGLWNRGNVLLGLYGQFHGAPVQFGPDVSVDLGLIVSNDGLHFREPEVDFKALGRGRWDVGFLMQVHGFAQVGEETWVWYSGLLEPGNMPVPRETGLAMWRRDGFGYLSVKDRWEDGHLLTGPVSLDGEPARVYLNVDHVGEGAWARVEVLDEADQPLPGYGAAEAVPIVENGARQAARWQERDTILAEDRRLVTLRVSLHPTASRVPRLYAVYVAGA